MSVEALVANLAKQCQLYEMMLDTAVTKTEVLKKGDVDSLQEIMRQEQKFTAEMTLLENGRQTAAASLLNAEDESQITITDCIEATDRESGESLRVLKVRMLSVIDQLQGQNDLNKQLIYQSLQFVNMNLDLLRPDNETATYGRPDSKKIMKTGTSFFDSKA